MRGLHPQLRPFPLSYVIDVDDEEDDDLQHADGPSGPPAHHSSSEEDELDSSQDEVLPSYPVIIAARYIPPGDMRYVSDECAGTTDMEFSDFLSAVAGLFSCTVSHLTGLSYTTSLMPKTKATPKLLRTSENFDRMMSGIVEHYEQKARGKGKKNAENVTITVEDMSAPPPAGLKGSSAKVCPKSVCYNVSDHRM